MFPQVDLHIYERSMFSHRFYVTDCDGAPADLTGHSARLEIRRTPDESGTATVVAASSSSGLLLTYAAGTDFATFTPVRFTTTGTLPTGLSANTTYYLIRVSATTAIVATSIANALAGTAIAYTNAGSGVHTMTTQMWVSTSSDDLAVNAAGGYVDLTWTGTQTEAIGSAHGPVLRYDMFVFPTGVPANAVVIAHGHVVAKKNVAVPA